MVKRASDSWRFRASSAIIMPRQMPCSLTLMGGGAGGCTVCNVGGTRVVSQNVSHYCSLRALRLVLDRAVPGVRDGASARVVFGWIILSDFNVVSCL